MNKPPRHILPLIVFGQFTGTSLWFAGNAVLPDLQAAFGWPDQALSSLTGAVQTGFITGTLLFALLTIADRFLPSRVFFVSALLGALANMAIVFLPPSLDVMLVCRFLTGVFLAGIYPVGMKIAADWYKEGLGKALGYLVGALVVGTAFPHLVRGLTTGLPWSAVLMATSALAILGAALLLWKVPEGPHRKKGASLDFTAFFKVFKDRSFRGAAFGYFGHMWELYAFWAMVPVILEEYAVLHPEGGVPTHLGSFVVIAVGGVSCVLGGYQAMKIGSAKVARWALLISGMCIFFSPFFFYTPAWVFYPFLLLWGMAVIADSPQFSTLVARHAAPALKGTALTVVNCIGFALTIFSIDLLVSARFFAPPALIYLILLPGPIIGLLASRKLVRKV